MATERNFNAVPPVLLTANGTTEGIIQVTDTAGFYFGMQALLKNNTPQQLTVYIKRVVDNHTLWVGPTKGGMDHNVDVSAFTVATASNISAAEQLKAAVPMEARLLATYETDPVNAWRTASVDSYGNHYTDNNPLPVAIDGTISVGDVSIVEGGNTMTVNTDGSINVKLETESIEIGKVDQGTPNTLANAWPVKPTDGTNIQSYTSAGEAKVTITEPLPAGINTLGNLNTNNDHQGSGSISSNGGTIVATTNGCSTIIFTILGTWSISAMLIQGTVDGTNWVTIYFNIPGGPLINSFTANGTYIVPCGGFIEVRLLAFAYVSGTLNATWDASSGINLSTVLSGLLSQNISSNSNIIRVANSVTSVSLLTANSLRKAAYFYNDSSQIAYISLSSSASTTTAYTLQMAPLSFAATDDNPVWTGAVTCIWAASGTGGMQITELS